MSVKLTSLTSLLLSTTLAVSASGQIYVAADAAPGGNGTSWATAFNSLSVALQAGANALIYLKEGVYRPVGQGGLQQVQAATFLVPPGAQIYGGFVGTETSHSARLGQARNTVLDGDVTQSGNQSLFSWHVVTIDTSGYGRTRLDRVTVRNGNSTTAPSGDFGGGIYFEALSIGQTSPQTGWTLDVIDSTIRDNLGTFGAGLFARGGCLNLYGCHFLANSTGADIHGSGAGAFAIFCGSGYNSGNADDVDCHIYNTQFKANDCLQWGGGLVVAQFQTGFNRNPRSVVMNCVFDSNQALRGGGAFAFSSYYYPLGSDWIDCTFSRNSADVGGGLAIDRQSAAHNGDTTIVNCILFDNQANVDPELHLNAQIGSPTFCADTPRVVRNCDVDNPLLAQMQFCIGKTIVQNFYLNPVFENPMAGNFNLAAGSPCLNNGTATLQPPDYFDADGDGNTTEPMPYDYRGMPRINPPGIDRGAYER